MDSDTREPDPRLETLFAPRSIAIVGASADPLRIGGRLLRYLLDHGYHGTLYPVNPGREEVQGCRAYRSLRNLPAVPDLALLCVGAPHVLPALQDAVTVGIPSAVILAAGFAESGPEGTRRQAAVAALGREAGMRLLGPNSLGFRNTNTGLLATFASDIDSGVLPGTLALISQSGGLAAYFGAALPQTQGVGAKWVIDTGNEADVEVAECLEYVSRDPEVAVIGLMIEGCRDGRRLLTALDLAHARGKPVVVLKVARSAAGAQAAASHTGALAGADAVYDAAFRQHGVYRARDEQEFSDILRLYAAGAVPRGRRAAIMSLSGGVATLLLDACAEREIAVPPLPPPADASLAAALPSSHFDNPLDLSGNLTNAPALLAAVLDHVTRAEGIDTIVLWLAYTLLSPPLSAVYVPAILAAAATERKPIQLVGLATPEIAQTLREHGVVTFSMPTHVINALDGVTRYGAAVPAVAQEAVPLPPDAPSAGMLTGVDAARLLPGIPFVPTVAVASSEAAVAVAEEFGWPVVVKGERPGLAHKTEFGLIRTGLASASAVMSAYTQINAVLEAAGEGTITVQPHLAGIEMVLGLRHDQTFGPVLMVGFGGIYVEHLRDVAFALPPIDRAGADALLRRLRGYSLLAGARGRPAAALDDLLDALVALSRLALGAGGRIAELDLNPFIVGDTPGRSAAVDAVLVLQREAG
jgi:acyl-CoA synthetase (NDP forming)